MCVGVQYMCERVVDERVCACAACLSCIWG